VLEPEEEDGAGESVADCASRSGEVRGNAADGEGGSKTGDLERGDQAWSMSDNPVVSSIRRCHEVAARTGGFE